ncbi:MAG: DUF4388 domain-containing protein [Candidatus Lernaella stagnicola]|nr:DUF4388 domain-containing protein [Candidatus Lernaella stagnicola]
MPINHDTRPLETPAIKGSLTQIHPARLIYGFFKAKKRGVLSFDGDPTRVRLYLNEGCLVLCERFLFEEPEFGLFLVHHGVITSEELQNFGAKAKAEETTALHLMIEQKMVQYGQIRRLAGIYYERNIMGLFNWRSGDYAFYEQEMPDSQELPDPQRTLRWLIDGIRKYYHPGMIEDRLRKRSATPLKTFKDALIDLDDVLVTDAEKQIGQWIREGKTPGDIVAESELDAPDVRALIFGLLTIECAKFARSGVSRKKKRGETETAAPTAEEGKWEWAFRQAEKSVDRIHEEVAQEPEPEPAAAGQDEHHHAESMKLAAEILRRAAEQGVDISDLRQADSTESLAVLLRARIKQRLEEVRGGRAGDVEEAEQSIHERPADVTPTETSADDVESDAARHVAEEFQQIIEGRLADADDGQAEPDEIGLDQLDDFDIGELPDIDAENADDDFGEMVDRTNVAAAEDDGLNIDFDAPDELAMGEDMEPDHLDFAADDPADQIYRMGVALLEQEEFERGFEALNIAQERGFAEPSLHVYLGWAYFKTHERTPETLQNATARVREALKVDQRNTTAYVYLGRIHKEAGDTSMAELYFVKALEIDPDCRAAKEAIRDIYSAR